MNNSEDLTILAEELIEFAEGYKEIAAKEKALAEKKKALAEEEKAIAEEKKARVERFKLQIEKLLGVAEVKFKASLSEDTFKVLKWRVEKGNRLGDYEVAYKNQNVLENWQHCFNVLKQSNAVIGNRFHLEGFAYAYWIYPEKYDDRIFRKQLNSKEGLRI